MKSKKQIEYDWDKIPSGSTFTARIGAGYGLKTEGRIFVADTYPKKTIYLCQDEIMGALCHNTLGYTFSWCVDAGNAHDLARNRVRDLKVWLPEPGFDISKYTKGKVYYYVGTRIVNEVNENIIKVGCHEISFKQVEKIYNQMLKLRKNGKKSRK